MAHSIVFSFKKSYSGIIRSLLSVYFLDRVAFIPVKDTKHAKEQKRAKTSKNFDSKFFGLLVRII